MKKIKFPIFVICFLLFVSCARAQFSFELIDNFESGRSDKWYNFGGLKMSVVKNASCEVRDMVAESCGEYSLRISGTAESWYVGGIGTGLNVDASPYSRLQMDIYGGVDGGKIKVELFDDDNANFSLEQDPSRDWLATKDDKWAAEAPVLGSGFTRISVPFSAFRLENPGCGDGVWNPDQKDGSGGLLKIQMILLTGQPAGKVEAKIDNVLLTY